MVKFLTLFVGLVMGVQDVQLAVSGSVARVELRLDGAVVARATGEPWSIRCDFGREPRPSRLEAVAYDAQDRIVGSHLQWINVPTERADAAILPITDADGRVRAARLTWQSPEFGAPRAVRASLDGVRIDVARSGEVDLGDLDQARVHVLSVEFLFDDDVVLRRELAWGEGFADDLDSGLTALPVVLHDMEELPAAADLSDWFTARGEPVRVAAVEHEPARIVIVADPATHGLVEELHRERKRGSSRRRRGAEGRMAADELAPDVEVHVLIPEPRVPEGRTRKTLLFPISSKPMPGPEGILRAVLAMRADRVIGAGLMVGDGVAMAALRAAERNCRRAVLLLLGPEREDISRLRPAAARRFLGDLRVPLLVWNLAGVHGSPPGGWDPDREVRSVEDLGRAIRRLRTALDQQRIVWIAGRHLPQELELGPAARGISLAR